MELIKRYQGNPILGPNPDLPWGRDEARNPGVIFDGSKFHMVFTASTDIMGGGDMVLGTPTALTASILSARINL